MLELVQLFGVVVVTLMTVASVRVLIDLWRTGVCRVREIREEGGGLHQKATGELMGGQRSPSTARAHGLHMTVRGGKLHYREKSVIAKEAA